MDFKAKSMDELTRRMSVGGEEERRREERVSPWITGRLVV